MKHLVVLEGCVVFLLGLAGCSQHNMLPKIWDGEPPIHDALPDFFPAQTQTVAFPESMVGVWEVVMDEYHDSKWGIKFELDGSIKKIIHSVAGPINVAEGGVNAEGPEEGTFSDFIIGTCEARYIPETRLIKAKIFMDYFIMKLPTGELEGRMEDYFEGPVSEDGKTWKANWLSFGWIKGANPPDVKLIKANPEPLVFTKLDLTQIKKESDAQ